MAIRYQRSVSGNSYDPLNAPDNADRLQEQSKAYIDSLKRRREQETLQQAAFVEGMRRKVSAETSSLEASTKQSAQQFETALQLEKQRDANEAQKESYARQAATGRANPTKSVLDFVTQIVPDAVNQFATIQKEKFEASKKKGIQIAMLFPSRDTIAKANELANGKILSAERTSLATFLEASGADPNIVEQVRNADSGMMAGFRHSLSKGVGYSALGAFNAEMQNPETQYKVEIDGQAYPISQLPKQDATTLNQAWMEFLPDYFGTSGFDDVSADFLSDGLQIAQENWYSNIATIRQNEIANNKKDILSQNIQQFSIEVREPGNASNAVQDLFQAYVADAKSLAVANEKLVDVLGDPSRVSDSQWQEIKENLILPGRSKKYSEDRPYDIQTIEESRRKKSDESYKADQQSRLLAAEKEAVQLRQMIVGDRENDNQWNIAPEQRLALYNRIQAEGLPDDPRLAVLKENEEFLAENVIQKELQKEFDGLLLKGALTESRVFKAPLDPKIKMVYYEKIKSGVQVNSETKTRLKQYIQGRLAGQPDEGYIPGTNVPKAAIQRATDYALQKALKDYVNFAKSTDGKDPYNAALGLFENEMSNPNGIYAIYTDKDVQKNGVKADQKGQFKSPEFFRVDAGTTAPTDPIEEVNKIYQKYGNNAIKTEGVIKQEILEQINDDIQMGRRGVIPPIISVMADRYNVDPLTVIEQQFIANNIEYDEKYFKPAKEAIAAINPVWKTYLQNNPKPETTDAALIGSGKQPIYMKIPQAGLEIKRIIMSRESPIEGYNAMNNGTGGDRPGGAKRYFGKEFKDMTLNEVIDLQQSGVLWAAGAYQFVPNTLPDAMRYAGISGNERFTPEVQDALFLALFDERGIQPWAPNWSNKATQDELNLIKNFRNNFDYQKPTWRQSNNMNPQLVYRMGSLGYGSTGPHADVKPVVAGSVYGDSRRANAYKKGDLDRYVLVKHNGKMMPLSQGTVTTDNDAAHRNRGSYGHDYATPDGTSGQEVYLTNGARVIENWVDNSAAGQGSNRMVIELPNGKRYAFVHGTGVTNG